MEYVTAKTYKNWEWVTDPYDKEGKPYVKVKCQCDRCVNGVYACRVENNQIVPHPAYGGICLKCGGTGYISKEVRLYTPHEFEVMERNARAAKERKEVARREQMEKEYAHKKEVWLETHGFAEDGTSYIVTGDSYSIKDQLKEDGFKYDTVLLWHRAYPDGYEDRTIKINVDEVISFSAWGEGHFLTNAKDIIQNKLKNFLSPFNKINNEWLNEHINKNINNLEVKIISIKSFSGRFGLTQIITFLTKHNKMLKWFTSTNPAPYITNDIVILKGKIKNKIIDEYEQNQKVTILTRCKITKKEED